VPQLKQADFDAKTFLKEEKKAKEGKRRKESEGKKAKEQRTDGRKDGLVKEGR
jgi:hypothetical protein